MSFNFLNAKKSPYSFGSSAYYAGKKRNPLADKNFCKAYGIDSKNQLQHKDTIELWLTGWDVARNVDDK